MKKNKGFSLVEVLVALGILGVVGLGATTVISNMLAADSYTVLGNSALSLKNEFTAILRDKRAWAQTIADTTLNPDAQSQFACLRSATDCASIAAGAPYPFVPKTTSNQLFRTNYNPIAAASAGFDKNGQYCTTYSTIAPTDLCSMRYTFTWTPLCPPAGACVNPQIKIALVFAHSGTVKVTKLNADKYGNTNIIIGNLDEQYTAASCVLMGGSWNSVTSVCSAPPLVPGTVVTVTCTSASYNASPPCYQQTGAPICGTLSGGGSGGSASTGGAQTCTAGGGLCNCTVPGAITTICPPAGANGSCTCPAVSCPTFVSKVYSPATPVSPASYTVTQKCSCP